MEFCICLCVNACTQKTLLFSSFTLLLLPYIIEVVNASLSFSFLEESRPVMVKLLRGISLFQIVF